VNADFSPQFLPILRWNSDIILMNYVGEEWRELWKVHRARRMAELLQCAIV